MESANVGVLDLRAAVSWVRGKNEVTDNPLNSVDPPEAVLGIDLSRGRLQVQFTGTFVRRKQRVDDPDAELFRTPGYAVFDVTVGYKITQHLDIRAGIFNLTDRKYWRWSEVRGLDADDPVVEVLSRPGTNVSAALSFHW